MKCKWKIPTAIIICAVVAAWLMGLFKGEAWSQDFDASLKKAADQNRTLLVNFTGSDWCVWCIKLDKEVFSHDEFKRGVKDGFVLVELDYPKKKSKLSPEIIAQNAMLKEIYPIMGYPTVLLLDGEGKPFAATGYQKGGPEKYVAHLKELSAKKAMRDKSFANAKKLEGVEKSKALIEALVSMGLDDAMLTKFYGKQIDEIKATDPDDVTGFIKEMELKQKFAEFEKGFFEFAAKKKYDEALEFITKTSTSGEFEGAMLQKVLFKKIIVEAQKGDLAKAIESIDEADAVLPGSPMAPRFAAMKARLQAKQAELEAGKPQPKEEQPAKAEGTQ